MLMILPTVWALTMLAGLRDAAWSTASWYMTGVTTVAVVAPDGDGDAVTARCFLARGHQCAALTLLQVAAVPGDDRDGCRTRPCRAGRQPPMVASMILYPEGFTVPYVPIVDIFGDPDVVGAELD